MQLRDLEYVEILAKEKNFSTAAAKLFISQPTLSQAIQKLENELNVSLFARTTKSVKLTPAGEIFLAEAQEILRRSNDLKKRMEHIVNLKEGHLTLGISTFYSSYYLEKIIPVFRNIYPSMKLFIKEDISIKLEEYVLDGTVDVSLIPLPTVYPELETAILKKEQILLAIPPESHLRSKLDINRQADYPYIHLADVKEQPFVYLRKEQRFSSMGIDACQKAGFYPKIAYEISNWDCINTLIGCGLGVGFVSELVTKKRVNGALRPIYCNIAEEPIVRSYAAVYRKDNKQLPFVQDFINVLLSIFQAK